MHLSRLALGLVAAATLTTAAWAAKPAVKSPKRMTKTAATVSSQQDWPSFRGPERTGVSTDTGLLQKWPEGGPPLVWESKGAGRGYASLAVAGDKIFTLGDGSSTADDSDEYLLCFDRANGKPLWKLKTGTPWTSGQPDWQSSRSTPTVDGPNVYALTAEGTLICAATATGKELWRVGLKSDLGGKKGDSWGYSESVLIDGDKLVCTPGGPEATMVALDKHTGKLIWKAQRAEDRGAGHASIVIAEIGGARVYVNTTASGLLGVRANDGKLLWSYPIKETTCVIPTPIVRDDLVFFAVGYGRGGALLKQVPAPNHEVKVEVIYPMNTEAKAKKGATPAEGPETDKATNEHSKKLANKHGGVVLVGDYLYADSDDKGIPYCAELITGDVKWQSRSEALNAQKASGGRSAAFAAADGCLYIHFATGLMLLAKADPSGLVELGSFVVPGSGERPSWSHPVIVGGKLYLREQDRILCYDVRAK